MRRFVAARLATPLGQQSIAAPFSLFPITISGAACDGRPLRFPATGMRLLFPHLPPVKHKEACNSQVSPRACTSPPPPRGPAHTCTSQGPRVSSQAVPPSPEAACLRAAWGPVRACLRHDSCLPVLRSDRWASSARGRQESVKVLDLEGQAWDLKFSQKQSAAGHVARYVAGIGPWMRTWGVRAGDKVMRAWS